MSRARTLAVMRRIETLRWALAARQQGAVLTEHRRNAEQRELLHNTLAVADDVAPLDQLALRALLAPAVIAEEQRLSIAAAEIEQRRRIAEHKLQRTQRRRDHLAGLAESERAREQRRRDQREDEQSAEIWHAVCRDGQ